MRVISGTARGRKLVDTSRMDLRPTSAMVKESIFNIVQFDIEGRRVLDLYAGTGQLGIEALSRGARSAVFVDFSSDAIKTIHSNLKLCGFSESSKVLRREALRFIETCEEFDLIFLDPPYATTLAAETINKIIEFDKLNTNGIIICETKSDSAAQAIKPPYLLEKEYIYGSVKISRITRE